MGKKKAATGQGWSKVPSKQQQQSTNKAEIKKKKERQEVEKQRKGEEAQRRKADLRSSGGSDSEDGQEACPMALLKQGMSKEEWENFFEDACQKAQAVAKSFETDTEKKGKQNPSVGEPRETGWRGAWTARDPRDFGEKREADTDSDSRRTEVVALPDTEADILTAFLSNYPGLTTVYWGFSLWRKLLVYLPATADRRHFAAWNMEDNPNPNEQIPTSDLRITTQPSVPTGRKCELDSRQVKLLGLCGDLRKMARLHVVPEIFLQERYPLTDEMVSNLPRRQGGKGYAGRGRGGRGGSGFGRGRGGTDCSPNDNEHQDEEEEEEEEEENEDQVANPVENIGQFFTSLCMAGQRDCVSIFVTSLQMSLTDEWEAYPHSLTSSCVGHPKILKFLLDKGCNQFHNCVGWTGVFDSARVGDAESLKLLLDAGVKSDNQTDNYGYPIHFASTPECVEALAKAGADMNDSNRRGSTALDMCKSPKVAKALLAHGGVAYGGLREISDPEVARVLIEDNLSRQRAHKGKREGGDDGDDYDFYSYDPNRTFWDRQGGTVLHNASFEMSKVLLSFGAQVDPLDDEGVTPMFGAGVAKGELLLLLGAGLNTTTKKAGSNLLHHTWSPSTVKWLLEKPEFRATVHTVDKRGQAPLHCAVTTSHRVPVARCLLEHGADVNVKDADGWTPLHRAANPVTGYSQPVLEAMTLLLEQGADPHLTNKEGKTPRQCIETWDPSEAYAILKYGEQNK